MKRLFVLSHPIARQSAVRFVQDEAPDGWRVTVSEPRKTREQEEKYHAMLGDISRQVFLHGKKRDEETVKRLCVDQFWRDTRQDPDLKDLWADLGELEMLPSMDGAGVVAIGWQTSKFPKRLAIAFIDWLYALGAENEVVWSEPVARPVDRRA